MTRHLVIAFVFKGFSGLPDGPGIAQFVLGSNSQLIPKRAWQIASELRTNGFRSDTHYKRHGGTRR